MKKYIWTPDLFGWQYKLTFEPACDQYDYIYISPDRQFTIELKQVHDEWWSAFINLDHLAVDGGGVTAARSLATAGANVETAITTYGNAVDKFKYKLATAKKLKELMQ